MINLATLGGIRIFGLQAEKWVEPSLRMVKNHIVIFDQIYLYPTVSSNQFLLPAHRGQNDYQIHLLEDETMLVIKDKRLYLGTSSNHAPLIIEFTTITTDAKFASFI